MLRRTILLPLCTSVLVIGALAQDLRADSHTDKKPGDPAQEMMSMMPKPGPEHARLMKAVGKWKASSKMWMAPGQPPMASEGYEEIKSICGGLWLAVEYKTTSGMPFEGHGLESYDPQSKKYVGTWIDSFSTIASPYAGTCDASGMVFTYVLDTRDEEGKPAKMAMQTTYKDANNRVFRMWHGPEPKGDPIMEITYTKMPS